MSPLMLKRIAAGLAVLIVLWTLFARFGGHARDEAGSIEIGPWPVAQVGRIAFQRGRDSVVLARSGQSAWTVNGLPASPEQVATFVAAAGDSTARSELIAETTASHERLGLDSAQALRVTITAAEGGETLADLWVGSRGPDFEGFYLRRAASPEAYLLTGRFAELLSREQDDWRDSRIASVAPAGIFRVVVTRGGTRWEAARAGGAWVLARGIADSLRMARFLSHFIELRASGFPEPAQLDSLDFTRPDRTLTLLGEQGDTLLALAFDATEAGSFFIRAPAGGPVYRLDGRSSDLAAPAESTLVAPRATAASPIPGAAPSR